MPGSYVRSIEENLANPWMGRHVKEMFPIYPAKVEKYPFPEDFPLSFRREKAFDALNAFLLRDVVLDPLSGGVWLPDRRYFLGESIGSLSRTMTWSRSNHRFWGDGKPDETDRILVPFWGKNYYHFMLEELPRALIAMDLFPDASLAVAAEAPKFVHAVKEQVLQMYPRGASAVFDGKVRAKRLCLVPAQEHSGFTRFELLEKVRKLLPPETGIKPDKKLYLSRKHTAGRAVQNEGQIEQLFQKKGFEVVYLERLSVLEQWKLLNSAGAVTGFSGAGFANSLFCRPGTRVCHIFTQGGFIDCFARMNLQYGHEYSQFMIRESVPREMEAELIVGTVLKKLGIT